MRLVWLVFCLSLVPAAPARAVDVAPDAAGEARILLLQARARIAVEDYGYALQLLRTARERQPEDADIHNLLGFTSRKLGRFREAHAHYAQALRLDPAHRGALEYWGELHLLEGDLAAAEGLLARLTLLCPEGCEERDELEAAIAGHTAPVEAGGLERRNRSSLGR